MSQPSRPPALAQPWATRQKARAVLEMLVHRIFGLCNHIPSAIVVRETRAGGAIVHAKITSTCPECESKYAQLTLSRYTQLQALTPFACIHSNLIHSLTICDPRDEFDDEEDTVVNLPENPKQIIAGTSIGSTGSIVTKAKYEKYVQKLDQYFEQYQTAHTDLIEAVANSNVNLEAFPEFSEESMKETLQTLSRDVGFAEQLLETRVTNYDEDDTATLFNSPNPDGIRRLLGSVDRRVTVTSAVAPLVDLGDSIQTHHTRDPITTNPQTLMSIQPSAEWGHWISNTGQGSVSSPNLQELRSTAPNLVFHTSDAGMSVVSASGTVPSLIRSLTDQVASLSTATRVSSSGLPPVIPAPQVLAQHPETLVSIDQLMKKTQLEVKQADLQDHINRLHARLETLSRAPLREGVKSLKASLSDVDSQFEAVSKEYTSLVLSLNPLAQAEEVQKFHSYMHQMRLHIQQLREKLDRVEDQIREPLTRETTPGLSIASGAKNPFRKLEPPKFSGKLGEFPHFKKLFTELTDSLGFTETVMLEHLKSCLPSEAVELINECDTSMEAWPLLERLYGDRETNILHVIRTLVDLDNSKGPDFERIERLGIATQKTSKLLSKLGANEKLDYDFEIAGKLIGKLPQRFQWEWASHLARTKKHSTSSNWAIFREWIEVQREAALQSRLSSLSNAAQASTSRPMRTQNSQGKVNTNTNFSRMSCYMCGKFGHLASSCPQPASLGDASAVIEGFEVNAMSDGFLTAEDQAKAYNRAADKFGVCPLCHKRHTYEREIAGEKHDWPSSQFGSCSEFKSLSPTEKGKCIETHKGCPKCTSWLHEPDDCWRRKSFRCGVREKGRPCLKKHHPSLHESKNKYCDANSACTGRQMVMLEAQNVLAGPVCGKVLNARAFYDKGSTVTLITHRWATKARLKGKKATIWLRVVGHQKYEEVQTQEYTLALVDSQGVSRVINAFGIDSLTRIAPAPQLQEVVRWFPEVQISDIERPEGEADILIGMDRVSLHPVSIVTRREMRLMKSQFGTGYILTGVLPRPSPSEQEHDSYHVLLNHDELPLHAEVCHITRHLPEFLEAEDLSYAPRRECRNCKECQTCKLAAENMTPVHRETVKWMEERMYLDEEHRIIRCQYPFNGKELQQESNYQQAVTVQKAIERKLSKENLWEPYTHEMKKAIAMGAIKQLDTEELILHGKKPQHYVTHFPVKNPSSISTKVRSVSNAAMKNQKSGLSFNDCLREAPNAINGLMEVLLRWRSMEVAVLLDLSKAYQSIATGQKERHLRRLLWRESPEHAWKIYAYDRVQFGDDIAALCLELARKIAAEAGMGIDSQAAKQIIRNGYIDDIAAGGTLEDALRMKGVWKGEYFDGTLSKILRASGFNAKHIVIGGRCTETEAESIGGKFLGVGYSPQDDFIKIEVNPRMRLSQRKRGRDKFKDVVELNEVLMDDIREQKCELTRRRVLAFLMSQYDPLGLLAPVWIRGKLLLQKLVISSSKRGWDDKLSPEEVKAWSDFIELALRLPPIKVPRAFRPGFGVSCDLIAFSDASSVAYGTVLYARWECKDPWGENFVETRIIMAKSRVAPSKGASTPRLELQAVVQCTRVTLTVLRAVDWKFNQVFILTDSECTVSAISKPGISFKPYFSHRVAEISENLQEMHQHAKEVKGVFHIPGQVNIADMLTRGESSGQDLSEHSRWANGPEFVQQEKHTWPISLPNKTVPTEELKTTVCATENSRNKLADALRSILAHAHSLEQAIGTTARVLRAMGSGEDPADSIRIEPTAIDRKAAFRILLLLESDKSREALADSKLLSLAASLDRGIVTCRGRFSEDNLAMLLGIKALPVLMPSTKLAQLIIRQAHKEDHRRSAADTVARARKTAWIVRGKKVAQTEVKNCIPCRKHGAKAMEQLMGEVPRDYVKAAAPFTIVSLDMFGPFEVRGMGGSSRKKHKVWGLVYMCVASKAVATWVVDGYDAKSFLDAHQRHTAVYGTPTIAISDHGSQLVAASKEIAEWGVVINATSRDGTQWKFTAKGCAWRNGLAERAVGMIKSSLKKIEASVASLNALQLQTTFLKIAMIINRRPIAVRHASETDYHAITPSDLLLGRATGRLRDSLTNVDLVEEIEIADTVSEIRGRIEEIVELWWKVWINQAFALLFPRRKWMTTYRNASVGDIVMLKYDSKYSADRYRLAKIVEVYPDAHGIVRTVRVEVRDRRGTGNEAPEQCSTRKATLTTGVQRLVVLLPVEDQASLGPPPETVASSVSQPQQSFGKDH